MVDHSPKILASEEKAITTTTYKLSMSVRPKETQRGHGERVAARVTSSNCAQAVGNRAGGKGPFDGNWSEIDGV